MENQNKSSATGEVAGIFKLGDVTAWIDQEAIHLKAISSQHNDPVELTAKEARSLAEALLKMVAQLNIED